MTNTPTTQLSGLELRKQVGQKLRYSIWYHSDLDCYSLNWPDGMPGKRDCFTMSGYHESHEKVWEISCPAFEKDLGALQASGIIDHEYLDLQRITREFYLDYPGQRTSEALAAWICRAFLSLPAETKG